LLPVGLFEEVQEVAEEKGLHEGADSPVVAAVLNVVPSPASMRAGLAVPARSSWYDDSFTVPMVEVNVEGDAVLEIVDDMPVVTCALPVFPEKCVEKRSNAPCVAIVKAPRAEGTDYGAGWDRAPTRNQLRRLTVPVVEVKVEGDAVLEDAMPVVACSLPVFPEKCVEKRSNAPCVAIVKAPRAEGIDYSTKTRNSRKQRARRAARDCEGDGVGDGARGSSSSVATVEAPRAEGTDVAETCVAVLSPRTRLAQARFLLSVSQRDRAEKKKLFEDAARQMAVLTAELEVWDAARRRDQQQVLLQQRLVDKLTMQQAVPAPQLAAGRRLGVWA
jgi:hypothetical protein